jgi:hypothetical protein
LGWSLNQEKERSYILVVQKTSKDPKVGDQSGLDE